ncbi:hypothetical protein [Vibrio quintilis]|uniref:Uncharacterized protein n=1 Tax=Vibrio quintilis TaxID=1117707 RepID=A0A1M7YRC6_9VIBR|nr:hypothetical protein [Vibrio quintilis]SHO55179.1 hypothetical protein VQ7734_00898 [Vibrio quintilis]
MIVNNISDELISEKSKREWLEYWMHFSAGKNKFCSEVNCIENHEHGVLVNKSSDPDNTQIFVVPLCKAHSDNFKRQLEIEDGTEVIPANLTL